VPDLSIVIVNWNTREFLHDCLTSIYSHAGDLMLEIVVVDNASTDGSTMLVREEFPEVRLIENSENIGYARANNQAFDYCSSGLILLLNPDTRILGDALGILVNHMKRHPATGAIGPKIVHPEMRLRVLSCGYQPTLRTLFNHYFFLSALSPHRQTFRGINLRIGVHDDAIREVEWLSGACILVKREVIDQVGPLSEEWFMYAEDMEWCQRMIDGGWRLYHNPNAIIEHRPGSSAKENEWVSTMWVRSLRSYFVHRQHPSRLHLALFDLVLVCGLFMRAMFYSVHASRSKRGQRLMWQEEAKKFRKYAVAALAAWKAG
jgi:N-acetylglucosaminyl-diphospho-decaprenol L-rhamnosyltransferase